MYVIAYPCYPRQPAVPEETGMEASNVGRNIGNMSRICVIMNPCPPQGESNFNAVDEQTGHVDKPPAAEAAARTMQASDCIGAVTHIDLGRKSVQSKWF